MTTHSLYRRYLGAFRFSVNKLHAIEDLVNLVPSSGLLVKVKFKNGRDIKASSLQEALDSDEMDKYIIESLDFTAYGRSENVTTSQSISLSDNALVLNAEGSDEYLTVVQAKFEEILKSSRLWYAIAHKGLAVSLNIFMIYATLSYGLGIFVVWKLRNGNIDWLSLTTSVGIVGLVNYPILNKLPELFPALVLDIGETERYYARRRKVMLVPASVLGNAALVAVVSTFVTWLYK